MTFSEWAAVISVVAAGVSIGIALSTVMTSMLDSWWLRRRDQLARKQIRLAREEERKKRLEKERFALRGGFK